MTLTYRIEPLHELLADDEVETLPAGRSNRADIAVLQVGLSAPRCVLPYGQQLRLNIESERLVYATRQMLVSVELRRRR